MAEEKTGVARWNEENGAGRHRKSETDRRRRVALLAALAVVCVACVVYAWPVGAKITRGLYLKGGTEVTLAAASEGDEEPSAEQLADAASAIARRASAAGVSEVATRVEGSKVVVDVPWNVSSEELVRTVCGRGVLEFVRVDEIGDADALAKLNAGGTNVVLAEGTYTPFLDGSHVRKVGATEVSSGSYALTFEFDDEGSTTFADVTRELAEDHGTIAILLDGRIVAAASVSQEIDGGQVSVSGNLGAVEANGFSAAVNSEELPVALVEEGSAEVGPLVGQAGLMALVAAALAGLVAAGAYAFVRYRRMWVLVVGALAVYACLMLGLMAVFSQSNMFVLTMPGVVGGFAMAVVCALVTLRVAGGFVGKVRAGGSMRGASLSCVGDELRVVGIPLAVALVVSLVLLFVPVPMARELGLAVVLGMVSGAAGVMWYAVTMLRLLVAGPVAADPAAWGLASAGESAREGDSAREEAAG